MFKNIKSFVKNNKFLVGLILVSIVIYFIQSKEGAEIAPDGPYKDKCTNIKYENGILSGSCLKSDGTRRDSHRLNVKYHCDLSKGVKVINNGALRCVAGSTEPPKVLDGYTYIPHKDMGGAKYDLYDTRKTGKIDDWKTLCNNKSECVGFNTQGWIKKIYDPALLKNAWLLLRKGIYIKNDVYNKHHTTSQQPEVNEPEVNEPEVNEPEVNETSSTNTHKFVNKMETDVKLELDGKEYTVEAGKTVEVNINEFKVITTSIKAEDITKESDSLEVFELVEDNDSGLSKGAIAGIAVGVVVFLILIGVGIYFMTRSSKTQFGGSKNVLKKLKKLFR